VDFFIPGARTIVRDFVHGCATCQKNKTEHLHPTGLLQPLGVPSAIWADISMDFIELGTFKRDFPSFQLEDELVLQGGRDVMTEIPYQRRGQCQPNLPKAT
jgi:hypothetical protein